MRILLNLLAIVAILTFYFLNPLIAVSIAVVFLLGNSVPKK